MRVHSFQTSFINQFWTFNHTFNQPYDFVQMTGPYFSSIASMCKIFNSYVWIMSSQFQTSLYATANLLSQADLEIEASRLFNVFVNRISASSMLLYDHVIGAQALYQPLDTTMSSFKLRFRSDGHTEVEPQTFDGCSCLLKPKECSKSSALYTYHTENASFTLDHPTGWDQCELFTIVIFIAFEFSMLVLCRVLPQGEL